jgi:hypothetical protein
MSHKIDISITSPVEELNISGYPEGIAFKVDSTSSEFLVAEPANNYSFLPDAGSSAIGVDASLPPAAEAMNLAPQLNITLGTLPSNAFNEELDGFKYSFPDFIDSGISTQSLTYGDVVYLESDLTGGANDWGAICKKAQVSNIESGAYSSLFIFISHNNNNLIILNKGFFDLEDASFPTQWTAGRTIYLNSSNNLDITPTGVSGSWVKSLGFCIPNKVNKKRIWFEPDSTYIKII